MKLKTFIGGLTVFFLLFLSYLIIKSQNPYKDNIIARQKNYIVYYNKVEDSSIDTLSKYDLAILEPDNISPERLAFLNEKGSLTFGYKSLFEVESYKKELTNRLNEEDYLHIDGVKQYNQEYKHYFGDIRSENYRKVILEDIEKDLVKKGFKGVFFDTLDDIEHQIDRPLREELYEGYIDFFKLLKKKYPDLSIIQNRAFHFYEFGSSELIDGLMYEDLKYQDIEGQEFYENLVKRLSKIGIENSVVILALSHEDPLENYKLAEELNWLYHFNTIDNNYLKLEDDVFNIDIESSSLSYIRKLLKKKN